MPKKYSVPVTIQTCATKTIGVVECDTIQEYREKAEAMWEEQGYDYPSTNISNDFEIHDWDLSEVHVSDLKYYAFVEEL